MEATGGPGVRVIGWSGLSKSVGKGKFYERIVFRHVNFNRSFGVLSDFGKFA